MLQGMAVWIIVIVSAVFVARFLLKGIKGRSCDCFCCSDSSCAHRAFPCDRKAKSEESIRLTRGEYVSEDKG